MSKLMQRGKIQVLCSAQKEGRNEKMPRMALMDVWRLDSCTLTCAGRSSCLHTVQLELADQGKSVVRYQGLVNNICCAGCFVLFCFFN